MSKEVITIYDVAREADVSMATVSRVVNGNPNVKAVTRRRVLEVIDRLDYRPNAVARGLASKRTTTIGVIIPDITNLYFASLARGIDDIAAMYKYNIILANSDQSASKELQVLNALLAKQVDGIIYMGYALSEEMRTELTRSKTPIVLAGMIDEEKQFPSVHIDTADAICQALEKFVSSKNERIAFVNGSANNVSHLKVYKKVLQDLKLSYDESLVFESDNNYKSGEKIVSHLVASKATAVFVSDDESAVGILNAALDKGLNVPQDLEIITSNNSKLTEMVRPQLSSVTPPLYDIGAVAMRLLTKIMSKEDFETEVLLPFKMTYRQSTK